MGMKPIEGSPLPGLKAPFSFDWKGCVLLSQVGTLIAIQIRSGPSVGRYAISMSHSKGHSFRRHSGPMRMGIKSAGHIGGDGRGAVACPKAG